MFQEFYPKLLYASARKYSGGLISTVVSLLNSMAWPAIALCPAIVPDPCRGYMQKDAVDVT
jgi:hypothetical protein